MGGRVLSCPGKETDVPEALCAPSLVVVPWAVVVVIPALVVVIPGDDVDVVDVVSVVVVVG